MRVRKVISRSNPRVTGKFASMKMRSTIYWESQIERDAIALLEINPTVLAYYEQPLTLEYRHNGEIHRYTPDFLVEHTGRNRILEVKPDHKLQSPENRERFVLIAQEFLVHGYEFAVFLESEIRTQPQLANAKLLLRYRCIRVPDLLRERLRNLLVAHKKLSLAWFQANPETGIRLHEIAPLVIAGILAMDTHIPLSGETEIWLRE